MGGAHGVVLMLLKQCEICIGCEMEHDTRLLATLKSEEMLLLLLQRCVGK